MRMTSYNLLFSKLSHLQYFYQHLSPISRILFWTQQTDIIDVSMYMKFSDSEVGYTANHFEKRLNVINFNK